MPWGRPGTNAKVAFTNFFTKRKKEKKETNNFQMDTCRPQAEAASWTCAVSSACRRQAQCGWDSRTSECRMQGPPRAAPSIREQQGSGGRKPCSTPHAYKPYWPPAPGRTPNTGKTQTGRRLVLVALRSARPLALVMVLVPRHRGVSSSTPPRGERNSGPQRWVYPEPQNVVLSGINVLADIVNALKMRSSGSGWGLNPRTSVLIRERKI